MSLEKGFRKMKIELGCEDRICARLEMIFDEVIEAVKHGDIAFRDVFTRDIIFTTKGSRRVIRLRDNSIYYREFNLRNEPVAATACVDVDGNVYAYDKKKDFYVHDRKTFKSPAELEMIYNQI